MELKESIIPIISKIVEPEIWYDGGHGTYIYQFVLQDCLNLCELTDDETTEIITLISTINRGEVWDLETGVYYIEKLESLFADHLHNNLYLGFHPDWGDYGIYEMLGDE